jgi:hypothetical protein
MKYLTATIIFVIGELVSLVIFAIVKRAMKLPKTSPARKASVVTGILERAVMYIGLLHGFPQILIAFGALKICARLHAEKKSKISNTYFLMGNLISILLAILYAIIAQQFWNA